MRIDQLREVDCSTRLSALASDNSLPLDPSTLIIECISEARNLDNDSKLLTRIDRRQGRPWKNLRAYWVDHENA